MSTAGPVALAESLSKALFRLPNATVGAVEDAFKAHTAGAELAELDRKDMSAIKLAHQRRVRGDIAESECDELCEQACDRIARRSTHDDLFGG